MAIQLYRVDAVAIEWPNQNCCQPHSRWHHYRNPLPLHPEVSVVWTVLYSFLVSIGAAKGAKIQKSNNLIAHKRPAFTFTFSVLKNPWVLCRTPETAGLIAPLARCGDSMGFSWAVSFFPSRLSSSDADLLMCFTYLGAASKLSFWLSPKWKIAFCYHQKFITKKKEKLWPRI